MNNQLFAVSYNVDKNSFIAGKPQLLFENGFERRFPYTSFDATADGQHIVALQFDGGKAVTRSEPTVILNWLDAIRQEVAAGQPGGAK